MSRQLLPTLALIAALILPGCVSNDPADEETENPPNLLTKATYALYTLPAIYTGPIGLYEPTIDVGPEGNLYTSSHSSGVGETPSPAYYSTDDGVTWQSMGLFMQQEQASPEEQGSAPILSDEVFIVAGEEGQAWGMDCCSKGATTTGPATGADPTGVVGLGQTLAPTSELPLVGWCEQGAEVCYYNENVMDHSSYGADASQECVPFYGTDRPWLAYNNGKLLLVNNPGTAIVSGGEPLGNIPAQIGAMDVPPATAVAYGAAAWGVEWNLCASTGGYIPGIPDMRPDHFFGVPQWVDFRADPCAGQESYYDVIHGHADDLTALSQTTAFRNSNAQAKEDDSTPSNIMQGGQVVFDADGTLFIGAMNNTAMKDEDDRCIAAPGQGAIHLAVSTDDAQTYTETTFRFDAPVSAIYMDGNRYGEGFLLNWGQIDGNHTDWYLAHVYAENGTLVLKNKMLAVDDGPEASRHVQGAALGPDGRAYMVYSDNSQNPGGAKASSGDTPLHVAVQQDGPVMPVG